MSSESFVFQAEITQLMSLIVNAFYSNKDVFLRELLSNASDANDKARYIGLKNDLPSREHSIELSVRGDTLVIQDTGIGMTRDEMIANLGTIANSGTKSFMDQFSTNTDFDSSMIGQFGVGFYSAFLVAKEVRVFSKHHESDVHCWTSDASGGFTIHKCDDDELSCGTRLELVMKDSESMYLSLEKIKQIVTTHCKYITYPIKLLSAAAATQDDTAATQDDTTATQDDTTATQDDANKNNLTGKWEIINDAQPLWLRKPDEVDTSEYDAFYRALTKDTEAPLAVKHFTAEGNYDFRCMLFVPKQAPTDMFNVHKQHSKINLHVRRVLVEEKCDDLVPEWLSFVVGIVDSEDLPLNVSREMLQTNNIIKVMRKSLIKKCVDMFNDLAEDNDKYNVFYGEYHQNIKLAIHESAGDAKMLPLLRFQTAKKSSPISLEEYTSGLDDTEPILYMTGASRSCLVNSPYVRGALEENKDVLLMIDPIDEHMMQRVKSFREHPFINISKCNDRFHDTNSVEYDRVCSMISNALGDNIEKVVVSKRLAQDTPCCLVSGAHGWSANMERLMNAQTFSTSNKMDNIIQRHYNKKVMEINPEHDIIKHFAQNIENSHSSTIRLLFDTAMLSAGFAQEDPSSYAGRVYNMISLGVTGALEPEEPSSETMDEDAHEDALMESLD